MKEYRKEVNVILSADKQLASEIEFDLKRFEREQENAQVAAVQPLGKPCLQNCHKQLTTNMLNALT